MHLLPHIQGETEEHNLSIAKAFCIDERRGVPPPGEEWKMDPLPDFGYDDYEGSGKLKGKVNVQNKPTVCT